MQSNVEVTHLALESYHQRAFEIVFDVFDKLKQSDLTLVQEFIFHFGTDELYESLKYHQKVVYSLLYTSNFEDLKNFCIWKYSVYLHRGLDVNYFLLEYEEWIFSISKHLYLAQASEMIEVYHFMINNHTYFVNAAKEDLAYNTKNKYFDITNDILFEILNGNKDKAKEIIGINLNQFVDIFEFIEDVIVPIMYKIGYLWQFNEISVAKEHLATAIIHEILDEFTIENKNFPTHTKPLAVVSVLGDELHNLSIKIIAKFLESYGYKVVQLGSSLRFKDVINGIYELQPKLLVFSLTLNANLSVLQKTVDELKESKVFHGKIIAGGQALFCDERSLSLQNVDFKARSLRELRDFINQFLD